MTEILKAIRGEGWKTTKAYREDHPEEFEVDGDHAYESMRERRLEEDDDE